MEEAAEGKWEGAEGEGRSREGRGCWGGCVLNVFSNGGREEEQKRTDVLQTVSIERLVIYKVCKSRDSAIEEERLYQGDRKNSCF